MMICVHCEATTDEAPCGHCGEDPLLAGQYRIDRVLGRGANGTTYLAERLEDGEVVALKELLIRQAQSLKVLELFEREARVLEQLDHPRIPRYVGDFTVELGPNVGMYLAQEYVEGESLDQALQQGPMSARAAFDVIRRVAGVLDYLSRRSPPVVHRDIKPANLIRRRSGDIALIDFGAVADAIGDGRDGTPTMAGTLGYMAPEQLMGRTSQTTDVYGLGATAVALLTGQPTETESRWSEELPRMLRLLLQQMQAQNPDNRPRPHEIVAILKQAGEIFETHETALARHDQVLSSLATTPREVPTNYDHQALETHAPTIGILVLGAMVTFSFVGLGGPLAAVFPVAATLVAAIVVSSRGRIARRRLRLFRTGAATIGRLDGWQRFDTDQAAYVIVWYTFHVDGRRYRSKSKLQLPSLDAEEGDDILILYDPDDPTKCLTYAECIFGRRRLT